MKALEKVSGYTSVGYEGLLAKSSSSAVESSTASGVSKAYLSLYEDAVSSLGDENWSDDQYAEDEHSGWSPTGFMGGHRTVTYSSRLQAAALAVAGAMTLGTPAEAVPYTLSLAPVVKVIGCGASSAYGFEARPDKANEIVLAFAIKKIRSYRQFEDGWAGPGSVAPGSKTLVEAERFVKAIYSGAKVDEAIISLSRDGQVNFYWNSEKGLIDLGVKFDGHLSYYASLPGGIELVEDDLPSGSKLPTVLLSAISA